MSRWIDEYGHSTARANSPCFTGQPWGGVHPAAGRATGARIVPVGVAWRDESRPRGRG
jgi:hypothetical protein